MGAHRDAIRESGGDQVTAIILVLLAGLFGMAADQGTALSGRVVDGTPENRPVRRAIVTVTGAPAPAGRSVVTDDEGRFSFVGLPAGSYTMQASRPAFLKNAFGATRPGRPGTPIALAAGQPVTDVVLQLPHGSAIEGVLRDIAGDPAPGMRVEAIRVVRGAQGERAERLGSAFTDDRGIYRIFGLPAGDYVLAATPATIVGGLGEIGAPTEAEVDAVLANLSRRTGGGTPSGPPPPTSPRPEASVPAPRRGFSTPATYFPGVVSSGEASRITIGVNEERLGADFGMKLSSAATISGNVVYGSGQPLPQVMVQIRTFGPELPVFGGSIASGPSVTLDRSAGTFRIANVPPGRYLIVARSIGAPGSPTTSIASGGALPAPGADGGPVLWAETEVQISGADMGGVTLTLQPAPKFSGRISFETSTNQPGQASNVRVQLEPVAVPGQPTNGLTAPLVAQTRTDGSFEFSAVIPGAYRMTATAPASAAVWARSATVGSRDLLDDLIAVRADNISGVTLRMSDRRPSIAGALSTPAGRPASGYFVVAFPSDRSLWRSPSRRIISTRPATNGAFELRDLPPGDYRLAVLTDLEPSDLEDASFLETLVGASVSVSIGEGERKTQNLRIGGTGPAGPTGPAGLTGPTGTQAASRPTAPQDPRLVGPEVTLA